MIELNLHLEYDDERTAKAVFNAILPDNEGYIESKLCGNVIELRIEGSSAGTVKNTADDLMACIKIAEEASGLISRSASDLDADPLLE